MPSITRSLLLLLPLPPKGVRDCMTCGSTADDSTELVCIDGEAKATTEEAPAAWSNKASRIFTPAGRPKSWLLLPTPPPPLLPPAETFSAPPAASASAMLD